MKINIDAPMKQKEITALLEASESPKYTYIGHPNGRVTTIQFETDETQFSGDPVTAAKAMIKAAPFGKSIALRVLEDGKNW